MKSQITAELGQRQVDKHNGGRQVVSCTPGRLRGIASHLPAHLSGLTVETSDGGYHAVVHEQMSELSGLFWRVHVSRFNGRTVDLILPIEGYCLVDLYQETSRQLRKLAPALVA